MNSLLRVVLTVFVVTWAASAVGAAGVARQEEGTFRSSVEVVTVGVVVRDERGRIARNLTRDDFQVLDSGLSRGIVDFWAGEAPISLGILLDISGSMAVGGNMHRARRAVDIALMNMRYGDEAALYTFDSRLEQVVPFTTQLDRIEGVDLEGRPWGTTSLFDAIAETARSTAERSNRHRALLVITDGVDTGSARTAAEVSGIASAIDVPVYLLVVVSPVDHPGGEFAVIDPEDDRAVDTATLEDLARWTGGSMRVSSRPTHTVDGIHDVFTELRHQYVLTFEPGAQPGWHPLEIRTSRTKFVVRARSGYVAGPERSGS